MLPAGRTSSSEVAGARPRVCAFALRGCCAIAERAVLVGARARSPCYRPAYSFTTLSASFRLAVLAAS